MRDFHLKFMNRFKYIVILLASAVLFGCGTEEPVVPTEAPVPSGVKLVASEPNSLTFSWDEIDGVSYYLARLETETGEQAPGGQTSVRENSIKYQGLKSNTSYRFMVKSKVGDLLSEFSAPVSAKTGETSTPPAPDPPSHEYADFMIPAHEDEHGKTLAFPGAEGGGMYTSGGRAGKVIHVTNLNDSGAGSLRAALAENGPRTIVFDVAGIIELESTLKVSKGDVTIAGQTAPGDGICIKNFSTQISASNVIIRFVRFRMGDEKKNEGDAVWGRYNENIILDHCSMSWSTDECASFYANKNFTMQWCIMTESLRNSVHGKGKHGYGGIWGGRNASFHHNLLANHDSRNPRFDHPQVYDEYVSTHRGNVDYRNNVVYNWGDNSSYGGEGGWFNMVNNFYMRGPASKDRKYFLDVYAHYEKDGAVYADSYPDLYLSGNVHANHTDITADNAAGLYWHNGDKYANYGNTLSAPLHIEGPSGEDVYGMTQSAEDACFLILNVCGASLRRDSVDERACNDAERGTASFNDGGNGSKGGIIDTQSAVGGWPSYEASSSEMEMVKDSDGDGMPDWFEGEFRLDASDPADGNAKTLDRLERYTNLEMYLHYIVRHIVEMQVSAGVYEKMP